MCIRQAKKSKQSLKEKFWMDNAWKFKYQQNILAANNLLKIFEPQAIINALNHKDYLWVTSLRVKAFNQCIIQEAEKIELERKRLEKAQESVIVDNTPVVITQPFSNNKSKFKDLD